MRIAFFCNSILFSGIHAKLICKTLLFILFFLLQSELIHVLRKHLKDVNISVPIQNAKQAASGITSWNKRVSLAENLGTGPLASFEIFIFTIQMTIIGE